MALGLSCCLAVDGDCRYLHVSLLSQEEMDMIGATIELVIELSKDQSHPRSEKEVNKSISYGKLCIIRFIFNPFHPIKPNLVP